MKIETRSTSQEGSVSRLRAKREERSQKRTQQLNSESATEKLIDPKLNINTSLVSA
jgi:hypothetical protein